MTSDSLPQPTSIEWRITGLCNENCAYCYGPPKIVHPDDETVARILTIIKDSNVNIIRFSGGEPLIYEPICSIFQELWRAKKRVVLSTNGLRFAALRKDIDPFIEKMNISVDGYDARTHSLCGRTPIGFERAVAALESLTSQPPPYLVKVGTVITSKSAHEPDLLPRLYDFLLSKRVDRWKIYQYVPEGPIVDPDLCVSDDLFTRLGEELSSYTNKVSANGNPHLQFELSSAEARSGAYFIVEPRGEVIVPIGDSKQTSELHLGNILDVPLPTLFARWNEVYNSNNHLANNFIVKKKGTR